VSDSLSMTAITEGDISMVEALRADLKRSSRAERRQLIREIPAAWLRMAVAMSDERWKRRSGTCSTPLRRSMHRSESVRQTNEGGSSVGSKRIEVEITGVEPKRYTLPEAEIELARRECALSGHNYDIIEADGADDPESIHCTRCGRDWLVLTFGQRLSLGLEP
jgi:hypothetical protein